MKTDFILYVNDSRQGKGYTKCTHMCAYNGEDGQKNWSQPA